LEKSFESSAKKKRVGSGSKSRKKSPNTIPIEFKEGNNFANTAKIAIAGMH